MNKYLKVLILFLIALPSSNAQCTIEDYQITFCDNETSIDLTASEPNSNGTYTYSENGIPISDPINFILAGSTDLEVLFTESGTNCTSNFTLSLIEQISPEIIIFGESVLNCLKLSLQFPIRIEPEGDYQYVWSGPGITNPNLESPTVELPGVYRVEVTDPISGCSTSADLLVTEDFNFPQVELDSILNCDSTVFLIAHPIDANSNYEYRWTGTGLISNPDSSIVLVNQTGTYQLYVEDVITRCGNEQSIILESLSCVTDLSEHSEINFSIKTYPNPVNDQLILEADDLSFEVLLFHNTGAFIKQLTIDNGAINCSNLSSGVYFLVFKKEDDWVRRKIIKI